MLFQCDLWLPSSIPPWEFMWGLSLGIYGVLKLVSWRASHAAATPWKQLAYLIAWPGMDADTFLAAHRSGIQPPDQREWIFAIVKLGLGTIFVWIVVPIALRTDELMAGWCGMVGIVLILHFGLFHALSCAWRHCGVAAAPLMNWPLLATSLSDFWGRRWNLAFRDLTHRFLFQPLSRRLGTVGSLLTGFFVSGLVHDVVISWPAQSGWGLPTCYFLLQGIGIVVERSRWGRTFGLGRGLRGRIYCLFLLGLPLPLLFHPAFVRRVILPFLGVIGAIR